MRTRPASVSAVLSILCGPVFAQQPGMSEPAARDLGFIAKVMSGHLVIQTKIKPDGSVSRSILSGQCPVSGESKEGRAARIRAISEKTRATWLAYFAKLADSDRSGFVSSEEGRAFKDRIYFALTAAQLNEVKSLEELEALLNEDSGVVPAALEGYPALQAAAERDGMMGLPKLPEQFRRPSPGTTR